VKNLKRLKRRWGPKSEPFDVLANPIISLTLQDDQYSKTVQRFLAREKEHLFEDRFLALIKKPRFLNVFNASAVSIEKFSIRRLFSDNVSLQRIAFVYKSIMHENEEKLILFHCLRKKFEKLVFKGDFESAEQILETCKNQLGESLWYIRSKFLVLNSQERFEELEAFSKECKERSRSDMINLLLRFSLLLESNPTLHFERSVMRTIQTLEEAQLIEWSDFLRLMFCPAPLTCFQKDSYGFRALQILPVVDQFWLLEKFVCEAIASHGAEGDAFNFTEIFDSTYIKADSENIAKSDATITELILLYEQGKYKQLVKSFDDNFSSIDVPFDVVNIVAKSIAIDQTIYRPLNQGVLEPVINALSRIYRVEASPATLVDDFVSIAIRLHYFYGAHCLQLSIFKALPHKYDRNRTTWLAKAAAQWSKGTILSTILKSGIDSVLNFKYASDDDLLIDQRRKKSEIRCAWSDKSLAEIPSLLENYKVQATLPKDFVELASSYYLEIGDHSKLLRFSAETLAENARMYIALPIENIVSFIIDSKTANLESLVILDIYVKYIDSQKEYLLHETYEEYLLAKNATRPTDILELDQPFDSLQLVFFRDICAIETMDYLGSFADSNELRSERVLILDALREKKLISPDVHREEVDEIIGQVMVDAGAAEFNMNKIEVNTAAIKRNIVADVHSMLELYRSLNTDVNQVTSVISVSSDFDVDDDDDDVISEDEEKLHALVTGDRNSVLLRILVLIYDAFLTDEKLGLDKNLSTEIRHGFFANLMRSRLEEHKLITEIDENGNYKVNQHWRDENSILLDDILNEIDSHLAEFSKGINILIEKAEEWMKISRTKNPDRAFVFDIYINELDGYHQLAKQFEAEEFIDLCFTQLWCQVEDRLCDIREKLNVNFKDEVNNLFDVLLGRIEVTRMNFPMPGLINSILQVKSEIREDITVASEWFKRSESRATVVRTVEELVKISIECFYRIRGIYLNCSIDFSDSMGIVKLPGYHAKAFIVVIVNLLENACRGSGFGAETPINIKGLYSNNSWHISIQNCISTERFQEYSIESLAKLDSKMRSPLSISLMRREGGSGLAKVFNQLRLIDDHFDVHLSLPPEFPETFEVKIVHEI